MSLSEAKVLVITADLFEESELIYPVIRLAEEGAAVTVASPDGQPVKGKSGFGPYPVGAGFEKLASSDFDALVIPGGFAPDFIRRSTAALDLVRSFNDENKPIAIICHGGWVAASAGILASRKMTSFGSIRVDMENAGAIWADEPVVVDGNLVTSRTPADLGPWMKSCITELSDRKGVSAA